MDQPDASPTRPIYVTGGGLDRHIVYHASVMPGECGHAAGRWYFQAYPLPGPFRVSESFASPEDAERAIAEAAWSSTGWASLEHHHAASDPGGRA